MDIIIKPENRKRIEKMLEDVQGKSRARTLSYEDIVNACSICEKYLGRIGLASKAGKEGVIIQIDPFGYVLTEKEQKKIYLHGYNKPESTQAHITYKNGSWRIMNAERRETGRKDRFVIRVTKDQERRIAENFSRFTPGEWKEEEDE